MNSAEDNTRTPRVNITLSEPQILVGYIIFMFLTALVIEVVRPLWPWQNYGWGLIVGAHIGLTTLLVAVVVVNSPPVRRLFD